MLKKNRFKWLLLSPIIILMILAINTTVCIAAQPDYEQMDSLFINWLNPKRDYLIIVNSQNEYIFGGDYDRALQPDLINLEIDDENYTTPVEKCASEAFKVLRRHMQSEGIRIKVYNAYRDKEEQRSFYNYNPDGWPDTNREAPPGFSEHHTGLLFVFEVWWPKAKQWIIATDEHYTEEPEFFDKIRTNLADYGFIERYPPSKEDITGYPAEPYEIRFVGSSRIAHEIMDNGLCLEEYLASE